ncbi:hypothetical protein L0B53_10265 [Vibrio sp. SS-MA-C1-2]|uniref:hypothetical protein n=1 Tax=Vibrio sp. SS-MA-C1-2 TaxID=2908646 RepID=UPI001F3424FE|nr:hypothetical protein [Vibrio sp. SS-MA-C1-2]UJF19833.1 hypothetical protein L0B53_10265 [Vibrio sp. SS-MA-C1-2]
MSVKIECLFVIIMSTLLLITAQLSIYTTAISLSISFVVILFGLMLYILINNRAVTTIYGIIILIKLSYALYYGYHHGVLQTPLRMTIITLFFMTVLGLATWAKLKLWRKQQ